MNKIKEKLQTLIKQEKEEYLREFVRWLHGKSVVSREHRAKLVEQFISEKGN